MEDLDKILDGVEFLSEKQINLATKGQKISLSKKGIDTLSAESRAKVTALQRSAERRALSSKINKGKKISAEHRASVSKALKGKKIPAEILAKRPPHPFKGKKRTLSKKHIESIKKSNADKNKIKKVRENQPTCTRVAILETGQKEWKYFISIRDASRYYDWSTLSNRPLDSFPKDGSVKLWGGVGNKRKGYQTKRIID